jgi:hypothetical protein
MRLVLSCLLCLLLAPAIARAQASAPADAPTPAPVAADVQAARAKSCAAFLSEVSMRSTASGAPGQSPSFALVWGALLEEFRAKYGADAALAKVPVARRVFDNTVAACRRAPARALGAAVEREFYQVR